MERLVVYPSSKPQTSFDNSARVIRRSGFRRRNWRVLNSWAVKATRAPFRNTSTLPKSTLMPSNSTRLFQGTGAPTHGHPQPGQQFPRTKGLGDVIIRTYLQQNDFL